MTSFRHEKKIDLVQLVNLKKEPEYHHEIHYHLYEKHKQSIDRVMEEVNKREVI